ncbi:hypothetical protein BJP40_02390 [Streptomyces sp. CC53]|uniref:anti-sigma factor family protein n=1 Tax=unclassified Streptomyces TaxID=2593676 RepID=UPI0008DC8515|nr:MULTISPECIES: zf-HC2 domain-containing protein [unclassified Streptomyces]OII63922.1 hypothetical protein BJP40_02390 [Streptomyces sp. CC53]
MSGTHPTPAEQHLGDRLAALVDGELGHDARERVLAHLATCARCKAEADAQRRVKSYFAQAAPPPPSEGLLARLQGLPALGDDGPGGGLFGTGTGFDVQPGPGPDGGAGPGAERIAGARGGYAAGTGGLGCLPAPDGPGAHGPVLPGGRSGSGFRIHEVGRPEAERSPWRGRRFAFAAASAVSFAAIALGGALPVATTADARGDGTGSKVTPLRSASGQSSSTGADGQRRRSGGALSTAGTGSSLSAHTGVARPSERSGAAPPPYLHAAVPPAAAGSLPPGPVPVRLDLFAPLVGPLGTAPGPYASDPVPAPVAGPPPTVAATTGIAAPPP